MPAITKVVTPAVTKTFTIGEESVTVTYRPKYLTPAWEERLKGLEETYDSKTFVELFLAIVKAWDLTYDEAGLNPIPLTFEAIKEVDYEVTSEILRLVQEEVASPNPETEAASVNTSPQAESSVSYPTGT